MRVMVTGGAGYIGAHVVRLLQRRGDDVVVVDDLMTGSADRVTGSPLIQLNLADDSAVAVVAAALRQHRVDAVIHLAARKRVAESVERPAWYYQQNVGGLANLLMAMRDAAVPRLLFSSSAAVYGSGDGLTAEDAPTTPVSPYGETKLVGEWLVASASRTAALNAVSLRYFNVAGAGWPELGDTAALNLIPMVFEKLDRGEAPAIFGADYDTPDGTCIRDYVHVLDLARAHLAVLDQLHIPGHRICNVGTGEGSSVREVIRAILSTAAVDIEPELRPRRPGDPASVIASVARIRAALGWSAEFGLTAIVTSAWEAHQWQHRSAGSATARAASHSASTF